MCLAVPARIVAMAEDRKAVVELDGVRRTIALDLLDEVSEGDYVIVHVGYALARLDPDEAEATLRLMAAGRGA
ncbi:MAG: HypC/HybG/HupF family hydrogenase formation chaperone [Zoogloeaceae bacterium]|nr:HypC/HybG/HupF family hydrogenase formation chaperone [Zoogloeaceae bacterium]